MLLNKIKNLGLGDATPAGPSAPVGKAPTTKSIFQNRENFGVNFGSLFVQEKFIFDEFFVNGTGTEFDGVSASIKAKGAEETRKALENHWTNYVNDDDWKWLQSKGVTAVRVPIGYWHVNGGYFTKDTPFGKIASVYRNAWVILKNLVAKAQEYDIGILIDLHALPGGANTADHSGISLNKAELWTEKKNEKIAISILEYIADEFKNAVNVIGLQIVNESEFSNDAEAQKHYYQKALKHIRAVDSTIPVIISDGWWPNQWVEWVLKNENNKNDLGVVIDCHTYRCFSDSDKQKSPEQIIKDLNGDLLTNLSGEADIMCGEYSCVLDGQSWSKASHNREELVRAYGQELTKLFRARAKYGSFFWTYKFQHGDGGEWGFVPQVNSGAIPLPALPKGIPNEGDFNNILNQELDQHSQYWNGQNPKEKYEHWRFKEGFITGWADATEFAKFHGSQIGRVHSWKHARRTEHINHRNNSGFLWEWDQGFDKALQKFNEIVFA